MVDEFIPGSIVSMSSSSLPSSSISSPPSWNDVVGLRLPNDEELRKEGIEQVIQRLRHAENEHKKLLLERSRTMKDVNQKLQLHLLEIRGVREVNQRLMLDKEVLLKDNEELSGICCFLDDDREKAKKVAREWQMFGRYATGVLQKELASCHSKIKDLEQHQLSFVQENRNLKAICIMLDKEKTGSRDSVNSQNSIPAASTGLLGVAGTRDSGDGSSNGSTTSNNSPDHRSSYSRVAAKDTSIYSPDPNQGESYIRYLEHKIRHLEEESKGRMMQQMSASQALHASASSASSPSSDLAPGKLQPRRFFSSSVLPTTSSQLLDPPAHDARLATHRPSPAAAKQQHGAGSSSKADFPRPPDDGDPPSPDDKEAAMVREMCNVVWRKLGDKQASPSSTQGRVRQQVNITAGHAVTRAQSVSNL